MLVSFYQTSHYHMPEYGNISVNMFLCFGLLTLSCDGVVCQYFIDAVVLKWNLCIYMLVPIDPYLQIHQSEHKNFQSPLVLSYTWGSRSVENYFTVQIGDCNVFETLPNLPIMTWWWNINVMTFILILGLSEFSFGNFLVAFIYIFIICSGW
jgi:hypothetical protein